MHLKKLRRAEGGAKIFGVFRVKNHDFTPKKIIFFPILGGAHAGCAPPESAPVYYTEYKEGVVINNKASNIKALETRSNIPNWN